MENTVINEPSPDGENTAFVYESAQPVSYETLLDADLPAAEYVYTSFKYRLQA